MHKHVFTQHMLQHCGMPCLHDPLQLVLQCWLSPAAAVAGGAALSMLNLTCYLRAGEPSMPRLAYPRLSSGACAAFQLHGLPQPLVGLDVCRHPAKHPAHL